MTTTITEQSFASRRFELRMPNGEWLPVAVRGLLVGDIVRFSDSGGRLWSIPLRVVSEPTPDPFMVAHGPRMQIDVVDSE